MFTEKQKVMLPKGIAVYPHLVSPDEYEGSLDYKTGVLVDPSDAGVQALIDEITETGEAQLAQAVSDMKAKGGKHIKAAAEMALSLPFEAEYAEDGTETGKIIFKVKSKAAGVNPKTKKVWEKKLPLFDSGATGKVKQIPHGSIDVWGGSVIRVEAIANPYIANGLKLAGMSFYINCVQVIELSNGGADGGGFGVEEGGFDASDLEEAPAEQAASDDAPFDDDDDF